MKKTPTKKRTPAPQQSDLIALQREQRLALLRAKRAADSLRALTRQVGSAKRRADAALLFLQHQLNEAFPIDGRLPGFEVTGKS